MRSQGILALIAALVAFGVGGIAHAQGMPVYVGPGAPPPYEPPGYIRAQPLPDDALLPREVIGILRSTGFSPLSPPLRRGRVYQVAVIDPNGEDGQVTIDAISGRLVRFVPADVIGRSMASYPPPPSRTTRRAGPRPPAPWPASCRVVDIRPMPATRPLAAPRQVPTASAGTAAQAPHGRAGEIKRAGKLADGPALLPTVPMPLAQGLTSRQTKAPRFASAALWTARYGRSGGGFRALDRFRRAAADCNRARLQLPESRTRST